MTSALRAAHAYARGGHRVLPLAPGGKTPRIAARDGGRGVHDATTDAATIERWWAAWPEANIGLAIPAGWALVDVDVRSGGMETLAAWERVHGPLPVTPTQITPTGGRHYVYGYAGPELRAKPAQGIDLLAAGRYMVVAPSRVGVARYRWVHRLSTTPLAPLPAWLASLAARTVHAPGRSGPCRTSAVTPSIIERARRYLGRCEPTIAGSDGHGVTMRVAVAVVRGFDVDEETAYALLSDWNATCSPPWSEAELRRKIREAARVGQMPPGALRDRRSA